MRAWSFGILSSAFLALSGIAASAADLGADMAAAETYVEPEMGSGWYLRGDIGYSVQSNVELEGSWAVAGVPATFSGSDASSNWSGGVGVGYSFGWVRAEISADYYIDRTDVNAIGSIETCELLITPADPTTCATTAQSGELGVVPILASLYFDIGTWGGLTPYVGFGVGGAFIDGGTWTTSVDTTIPAPPAGPLASVTLTGEDDFHFAYALMAGASYALTNNLSLDVGYRYLAVADGTAVTVATTTNGVPAGSTIDYKDLQTQEVRVGFRYLVN